MKCERSMESINGIDAVFIKSENCVVDWAKALLYSVRKGICGKCVFCREGTAQVHKIVQDISEGRGQPEDIEMILEVCSAVRDMADCELSRTAAENIAKSIEEFREEWEIHIKRKRCPALVCKQLVTYHILSDKCTGCTECLAKCPEGAIAGDREMIHVIDQDKCTRCGSCFEICSNICGALVKASGVKPQTPEKPVPVGSWQAKGPGLGLEKGLGLKKA